jgi:membrane associated rhomboid family serine protease
MDRQDRKKLLGSLAIAGVVVAVMWLMHLLIWVMHIDKTELANIPRRTFGLIGILSSPFVHDDIWHLVANSGPLFMFLAATLYFYRRVALKAMLGITLLSGAWVWLFAHEGAHIGASGVVYGLGAFLFFSGVFRWDVRSISLSLLIALIYGGMVWGVLPGKEGISWESHLFGAIAGVGMAWVFRKVDVVPRKRYQWEDEPENDPRDENAAWNYRQNWPGAQTLYTPGDSDTQE